MWALLLVAIVVAYLILKRRETREPFVLKYGNPFDGEDAISFDARCERDSIVQYNARHMSVRQTCVGCWIVL
jgi:hypothetical protein